MIGLRAKEWDVICGALLQAKDNEWDWIVIKKTMEHFEKIVNEGT